MRRRRAVTLTLKSSGHPCAHERSFFPSFFRSSSFSRRRRRTRSARRATAGPEPNGATTTPASAGTTVTGITRRSERQSPRGRMPKRQPCTRLEPRVQPKPRREPPSARGVGTWRDSSALTARARRGWCVRPSDAATPVGGSEAEGDSSTRWRGDLERDVGDLLTGRQ